MQIIHLNTDWTLLFDPDSPDVIARLYLGFIDYAAWRRDGRAESEGVPDEIRGEADTVLRGLTCLRLSPLHQP